MRFKNIREQLYNLELEEISTKEINIFFNKCLKIKDYENNQYYLAFNNIKIVLNPDQSIHEIFKDGKQINLNFNNDLPSFTMNSSLIFNIYDFMNNPDTTKLNLIEDDIKKFKSKSKVA